MPGIDRLNNLKISDFNRVAESNEAVKLKSDGTVIAKSSFASKVVAFFKPEKARRENQQTTATFVASITRTLTAGTQSGIFSKLGALSSEQKEAIVANLLNYKDASGKGILDDQLKGAKPLTGRKVAQVINLVTQQAGQQIHDTELNAIKNQIDEQVSVANDLQPQADRLRFGKLKLSEDGKTIEANISSLVKDLSANVDKLKREEVAVFKQFKAADAGPDADTLDTKLTELKEFIKSGELVLRDLQPESLNKRNPSIQPERSQDTRVLASSIGYLSQKDPLPESSVSKKSNLHQGQRVDKGDSRTYADTATKTTRVAFGDEINIGLVPGRGDKEVNDARKGEKSPSISDKKAEAELREALKDSSADEVDDLVKQAKFESDDVQDLDPEVERAKKNEDKELKSQAAAKANAEYDVKTNKS
jgi:hypothetical protein